MSRAARAALLLALASCTLPASSDDGDGAPTNACTAEGAEGGACGPEGVCVRGLCRPREVDPIPVVFELTRSLVSGADPGLVFHVYPQETLSDLRSLDRSGGFLDLGLPLPVSVEVSLTGPKNGASPTSIRSCFFADQAPDGTLPLHVTLRPSSARRGLQIATYASPARDPKDVNPPLNLAASLTVPPDTYDLYLLPTGDPTCPIPPILQFDHPITGPVNILNGPLGSTSHLAVNFTAPPSLDLSGWTARIVEPSTGLPVSTTAGLVPSGPGSYKLGVVTDAGFFPLEYYPPTSLSSREILLFLVLSPPAGAAAPSLAWDISLDVFNNGTILFDLSPLALDTVDVGLRVERSSDAAAQKARVWLRSQLTPGALPNAPSGALAAFSLGPLVTDGAGAVSATLPPGLYDAIAVPESSDPLDAGRKSFDFLPGPDGDQRLDGFTLAVPARPSLAVPILASTDGTAAPGLPFELIPSRTATSSAASIFGLPDLAPRGASGLIASDGALRADADAGLYDLTVRFPPERGFPWLVKPAVTLPLPVDGALRVSLPVEVRGIAYDLPLSDTVHRRPLVGATIRAFFLINGTHIPVATTTVDSTGAYRLLLPSRL